MFIRYSAVYRVVDAIISRGVFKGWIGQETVQTGLIGMSLYTTTEDVDTKQKDSFQSGIILDIEKCLTIKHTNWINMLEAFYNLEQ